jgi:hypothetical protein
MPDTNQPARPADPSTSAPSPEKPRSIDSSAPKRATPRSSPARQAHFVLQGKGGVGKSYIASLIAQFLAGQGRLGGCFDTDPLNASLVGFQALGAVPVELLTPAQAVNVKGVDRLIEDIVSGSKDVVIDNGAASFLPLSHYLIANNIAGVLTEHGVRMVVHTVITGGSGGLDTLKGLDALVEHFAGAADVVVWVNEYFGPAKFRGTDFAHTAVFTNHHGKIRGVIYLRALDPHLFAPNLAELLESKMTFDEAAASPDFMLMEKSRLHRIKNDIWTQLESVV